jgi:hypothetical protein
MGVHNGPLRDGAGSVISAPRGAGLDVFVVAFDSTSSVQWTQGLGSTENEFAASIAVAESTSSVYIAGMTRAPATLGDAERGLLELDHAGDGEGDLFVAELALADGAPLWADTWPGVGGDMGWDLAVGPAGEVYVLGSFAGELSDGTTTFGSSSGGSGGIWRIR